MPHGSMHHLHPVLGEFVESCLWLRQGIITLQGYELGRNHLFGVLLSLAGCLVKSQMGLSPSPKTGGFP